VAAFIVGALFRPNPPAPFADAVPTALYPHHQSLDSEKPSEFECGAMSDEAPVCEIHKDENGNVFVFIDGMKIAERGLPGTAQADTWIMLKPGWMVRDVKGGKAIQVSYEHAWMH
jgi:hypothetical protein